GQPRALAKGAGEGHFRFSAWAVRFSNRPADQRQLLNRKCITSVFLTTWACPLLTSSPGLSRGSIDSRLRRFAPAFDRHRRRLWILGTSPRMTQQEKRSASVVEQEVHHVAVLDDVGLALGAHLARLLGPRFALQRDIV